MRTIEWRGKITALSSIAHTGSDAGTRHLFRREKMVTPDGKVLSGVPILSGGLLRGSMRRVAAKMAQEAIAGPDGRLPFHLVHALRTGGSLRPSRKTEEVLAGEKQAAVRDLVPALSIFGFSAPGRIVSGRLCVDKGTPLARETAHLAPDYGLDLSGYTPPSIWSLLQQEDFTRFADVTEASSQHLIADDGEERELHKGSGNMLWGQETLTAGTVILHKIVLEEGTPTEVSFMDELVRRWTQLGRIGAQLGRGMGRVQFFYQRRCLNILGDPAEDEPAQDWREHVQSHRDQMDEVLKWL